MILKGLEATRYCARPDPARAGLLIFGADTMRVALKRQEAIAALIGPQGESEMRLTRIPAADLRKDAALLLDAIKAQGFFPGPRVAFVEDAADGLTPTIEAALKDWRAGDATIVVTAGGLTGKSALKTLFDKHPNAVSIGLYDDPPSREEIEDALKKAGLTAIDREAMTDLSNLARALDPGDFRQTLEKIALYKHGDATPLTPAEIAALAPATIEAEVDELVTAVADRRAADVGPLLRRLEGQGTQAVGLCIATMRHFRALHAAVTDPGGIQSGIAKARGIPFKARDAMARQAQNWGAPALEKAITDLVECDLTLRSASRAPAMAVMERTLLRLALSRGNRGR
ncbi:DNA polymerase III subunit delta [Rhodobacteraceae bacterium HSP-20]|uniref:DNA-directed DNA polymerase n=1 Tax=Paragemmobacter amnigenus TaxID=2852097 RepID=A0ABS6J1X1_9RHOB|nr:DNA polymerase III subunit delta [Rhodobacter amnigenus]MBU9697759.1 DNA polymerase III subunit delta [Rhodobacter amnigenus]MBV4388986.1 DNA polymerase III subunit delta [Rhodobacter amnigenus]